jgi:hypothetical protein
MEENQKNHMFNSVIGINSLSQKFKSLTETGEINQDMLALSSDLPVTSIRVFLDFLSI